MVTANHKTAVATMYSFRKLLFPDRVTLRTFLTRILRVYLQHLSTSVFSFVDEHMDEGRPPYIVNC
ncbi:MAG: hypothetical protein WAK20_15500, partial [Candidatus Acidiferrum sp.]